PIGQSFGKRVVPCKPGGIVFHTQQVTSRREKPVGPALFRLPHDEPEPVFPLRFEYREGKGAIAEGGIGEDDLPTHCSAKDDEMVACMAANGNNNRRELQELAAGEVEVAVCGKSARLRVTLHVEQ